MSFSLGRFMQGVGQVAVPAALEEQRARIQAKRDAALQKFEAAQKDMDRQAGAATAAADRAWDQEKLGIVESAKDRRAREKNTSAERVARIKDKGSEPASPLGKIADDLMRYDPKKYPTPESALEAAQSYELTQEALRFVSEQLDAQLEEGVYPGDPGYKGPEELIRRAQRVFTDKPESQPKPSLPDNLPSPRKHKGQVLRGPDGQRIRSDGEKWVLIGE